MFKPLHNETERVPFDVPFILFGVIRKKDTVLIDLDKNRPDFEDYSLESDHFCQWLDRTYGLDVSFSGICPDQWLQSL